MTDKYCGITNRRIISLYETLHGADIQKSYEVMDAHFASGESRLKAVRKKCGLTQETLAKASGVPVNTVRTYEHKSKDLNKSQADIIMRLTRTLRCEISDLLG